MVNRLPKNKGRLLKIAITGPESTGKTQLAEDLALYYRTNWVPEFAREYLNKIGRPYTIKDILLIAQGQMQKEKEAEKDALSVLFCDTELVVTKIWAEHCFGSCPKWILANLNRYRYDLYLLCNVDLPWVPDPLREHPQKRKYFLDLYRKELISRELPFVIISGTGSNRLQNAVNEVDKILSLK